MSTTTIPPEKMKEVLHFNKISPPHIGMKRQWVVCSECGTPQFYDYIPSLEINIRATMCQHVWSKMQEFDPMEPKKSKTIDTIGALILHAPELLQTPAFQENPILLQQVQAAMQHYAEEKATEYARFFYDRAYFWSLREQPYDWDTYTKEHPLE